jgi:hypothetical protein
MYGYVIKPIPNAKAPLKLEREQFDYIPAFGHYVPLYTSEVHTFNHDALMLAKARKQESKQYKACEHWFIEPVKFKKCAKTYLSSWRCLMSAMVEVNKKRPLRKRLSLSQIIQFSKQYKVLIKLDENVIVFKQLKSSGIGYRTIHDFGPVARGAQKMVKKLLRLTYIQKPFQYPKHGVSTRIEDALKLLNKEGYEHVGEIDIKAHYPSFELEKLESHLPLPKEAVRGIIGAKSANRVNLSGYPIHQHIIDKTCSGIPQGSVASSEVASRSVAYLKMLNVKDVILINYADNFFLFAKNSKSLEFALKALSSGVSKLPGGSFLGVVKKNGTVSDGFRMLGCKIYRDGDQVLAEPTERNLQLLFGTFELEHQRAKAKLKSSAQEQSTDLRLEGIQEFVTLKNFVKSWTKTYSCCGDMITDIYDDSMYFLDELCTTFKITKEEIKEANKQAAKLHFQSLSR